MSATDDGESIGQFEPLIVSEGAKTRTKLNELTLSLIEMSLAFSASLPGAIAEAFADIVRSVECYCSNLIEGHQIDPLDIDRSMRGEFSPDARIRDLQLEACAHIATQKWIDDEKVLAAGFSVGVVHEIHRRFCERLPPAFLVIGPSEEGRKIVLEPGAIRTERVQVGRHVAISPGAVPRFLVRMEQAYKIRGPAEAILAAACCHHRLLWVHPFLDGNGRVARLVSNAAIQSATSTSSLWSLSRGLARTEKEYRAHLQSCDEPRRGGLDGRGTLSEGALAAFAEYFLVTCIEEVAFMTNLMDTHKLRERARTWAQNGIRSGSMPPKSDVVVSTLVGRGTVDFAEIDGLAGTSVGFKSPPVAALIDRGIAQVETSHSRLRLSFPVELADQLLPGVFSVNEASRAIGDS
ncbi:Fic family protein [Rhizobium sp. X9]|uniref:Fic family protein n=1 Tax=Rhizobium sp. X9 TaxID=2815360 RepID=UPI001C0BBCE9|nr:Fic family protein [Rhizobium sp. X9]